MSPGLKGDNNDTRVGTRVKLSCPQGLTLVGADVITCLHTGSWDDVAPSCQHLKCPDIRSIVKVLFVA